MLETLPAADIKGVTPGCIFFGRPRFFGTGALGGGGGGGGGGGSWANGTDMFVSISNPTVPEV